MQQEAPGACQRGPSPPMAGAGCPASGCCTVSGPCSQGTFFLPSLLGLDVGGLKLKEFLGFTFSQESDQGKTAETHAPLSPERTGAPCISIMTHRLAPTQMKTLLFRNYTYFSEQREFFFSNHGLLVVDCCCALNVCVLPKFVCGNSDLQGDGSRRWGRREVTRS